MDNVTHTLVGALLGEAIARRCARSLPLESRRRLFVPTLAIGSNLPDLDLLYTTVGSGKFDYLLHHRGHTHTVIGALLLTAAMLLIYEWLWHQRGHVPTATERIALNAAAIIGPLLHIAMDATNSYGVHPYWPFDNRWRYGDAVFIIEPLFWAAAAPLVFLLRSIWARAFVALTLVAGIGLSIGSRMVPLPLVCVFIALSGALLYAGRRWPERAAALGVMIWIAVTAMFILAGQAADARLREALARDFPRERLLDAVHSPLPMNPLCWELMLVQSADVAHFSVRRAALSLAPQWLSAAQCPARGLTLPTTAPLQPVAVADTAALQWHGELTMSRAELIALYRKRCEVRALMQFARVPWLHAVGRIWQVGDLRFDRGRAGALAGIAIDTASAQDCPRWGAPWVPPRSELLQ